MIVKKNGVIEAPSLSIAEIDAGTNSTLPTKEWANSKLDLKQDVLSENNVFYYTDFFNYTIATQPPFTASGITSGTGAQQLMIESNHPGVLRFNSSTTANSGYGVRTTNYMYIKGDEVFTAIIKPLSSDATTRIGLHSSTSSSAVLNGVYFNLQGTNITFISVKNSVSTTSTAIVTSSINNWYKLKITINSDATSVLGEVFDANGVFIDSRTITTNIPNGTAEHVQPAIISTHSGTAVTALLDADYVSMSHKITR